ncbi:hypothetical protein [Brevundimonas sp.]|uniref:hypothetical protein n=1 Tax=Brevundimonas sp. TaxID=1871086 RepID=UPI0039196F04
MFDTLYTQIGAVFMIAALAFAMIKGEEPERAFSGVYLVAWLASMLVQNESDLFRWQPVIALLDVVVLLSLIGLSWKSTRSWPVWAMGFQLLVLMGLVIPLMDVRPPAWSYIAVVNLGAYGVIGSLAVGTFWAWQERRAAGLE